MIKFTRKLASLFSTVTRSAPKSASAFKLKLPPVEVQGLDPQVLPTETEINTDEILQFYKGMKTVRELEDLLYNLHKAHEIWGFLHLYSGQESIAAGVNAATNFDDCLITSYRDHGAAYYRGVTVREIIAELMAKKTGSSRGKGGSMHFYRKKTSFEGGNGIVGAQGPIGTGLAFALKAQEKPNVSVTMYGDGAANQGQMAEAANLAALWHLPCIFVCENNHYAYGTPSEKAAANPKFYQRLHPIPGIRFEANNVFHVRELIKFSKDYVLQHGPICLEMMTYRYYPHTMSDPDTTYRTRAEIDDYRRNKDCIDLMKKIAKEYGVGLEEDFDRIDAVVREEVALALEQARKDPLDEPRDRFTDVYVSSPPPGQYVRHMEYDKSIFPEGKY